MWILPNNHPLYSAYAPEEECSMTDWNAQSDQFAQSLMWKSKPSAFGIWLRRWKRVYWLPHLFSRILKPSRQQDFTERYTASLAAIRASRSATQGSAKAPMTSDTFFRIYAELSKQLDLFGASLKTCLGTSAWDMTKFTAAFAIWVMQFEVWSLEFEVGKRSVHSILLMRVVFESQLYFDFKPFWIIFCNYQTSFHAVDCPSYHSSKSPLLP